MVISLHVQCKRTAYAAHLRNTLYTVGLHKHIHNALHMRVSCRQHAPTEQTGCINDPVALNIDPTAFHTQICCNCNQLALRVNGLHLQTNHIFIRPICSACWGQQCFQNTKSSAMCLSAQGSLQNSNWRMTLCFLIHLIHLSSSTTWCLWHTLVLTKKTVLSTAYGCVYDQILTKVYQIWPQTSSVSNLAKKNFATKNMLSKFEANWNRYIVQTTRSCDQRIQ